MQAVNKIKNKSSALKKRSFIFPGVQELGGLKRHQVCVVENSCSVNIGFCGCRFSRLWGCANSTFW